MSLKYQFDPQSLNRYAYCRNNPVKYIDPTGHYFRSIGRFFRGIFNFARRIFRGFSQPQPRPCSFWKSFAWDSGKKLGEFVGTSMTTGINSYFNDPLNYTVPTKGLMKGAGPYANRSWIVLGITTGYAKAQIEANTYQSVVFYTNSRGASSDFIRAGMQKLFYNSLASRQFSDYLKKANSVSIIAHSEGTLTTAGAMKTLQTDRIKLPDLRVDFKAPVISKFAASNLARSIGANSTYDLNPLDPIGALTTFNPVKQGVYLGAGLTTFATYHGFGTQDDE